MAKTDKQKRLKSSVLALVLAFSPLLADAAGLGKMTVVSALGQPLAGEIDLTSTREEYASLSAKIASPEAFKSQGIEYVSVLTGVRFTLDKRPNGQAFLRVTSDRPINEPFVDMLVELSWASGRLVREYTFLLDPPELAARPAPVPVAPPEVKREAPPPAPAVSAPVPAAAVVPGMIEPRGEEPKPAVKPAAKQPVRTVEKAPPAPKPAADGAGREVKKGDTLAKIASENKPEGISLDQMLVALFHSNKEAFDAGNMNRLRAGKILAIPDKEAATAVDPAEARKTVVAQAADFNAYRKKLAAAVTSEPAREEAPKQVAAGRITPKVEDKTPAPAAGKDKLEVSRTEAGKDAKPGAKDQKRMAMIEEDLVARQKALEDANKRIVELEKNLNDLKKLAELKSAAGAKVQEQAQAAKPVPPAAEAKKPEPPAAPPAPAPKAAEAPAAQPVETPAVAVPAPPPSFVDESPELVFGGGGILALLLGYLGYGAWRRKKAQQESLASGVDGSELAASSVFSTTAGQSIDTGAAVPTDFSQESIAGVGSDEGVDPVAEADVYMAYGRDSQAEEILVEALKNNPTRHAIHLKLLEIYAARKSAAQFQAIAEDLHGQTGGSGADWEMAASLGLSFDPENSLYRGGTAPEAAPPVDLSASTVIMRAPVEPEAPPAVAEAPAEESMTMDFSAPAEPAAPPPVAEASEADTPASLDFDLDLGAPSPEAETAPAEAEPVASDGAMSLDFDLDLGAPVAEEAPGTAVAEEAPAGDAAMSMDFDLDLGAPPSTEAPAAEEPAAAVADTAPEAAAQPGNSVDFDFDLAMPAAAAEETPAPAPVAEAAVAEAAVAPLDLSAISLDLELPEAAAPEPEPAPTADPVALEEEAAPIVVEDNPEIATKIELAQAYEEMGDKDGARELLQEVLNEGSPAQQEVARNKLAQLG